MKTLSLTAAFAFLFFSSVFAGGVKKQTPKTTKATTAQKAPASSTAKPAVAKSPTTAKTGTASAKNAKPVARKPMQAKAKPTTAPKTAQKANFSTSKGFSRDYRGSNISMMQGKHHGKHHKGKASSKPASSK
jgi:hypothetical protein